MKNRHCKQVLALIMAVAMMAGTVSTAAHRVYASEETQVTEEGDNVVITQEDKPYLALGADLTADQQHTVLAYMGIDVADFDNYDVVYVNNDEEHKYLDAYVPKKQIGTKALSSVLISLTDKGSGIKVSTISITVPPVCIRMRWRLQEFPMQILLWQDHLRYPVQQHWWELLRRMNR